MSSKFALARWSTKPIVALSLLLSAAPGVVAQGLDVPANPLCKPCERAMGAYWEAWPVLDAKLSAIEKQEKALGDERGDHEKARDGARREENESKRAFHAAEMARIDKLLDALGADRKKASDDVDGRQLAVAGCIRRKCFMGNEGPAPSSPLGDAEKCKQCAALANRVALLDYRLRELSEIDKLFVTDAWQGTSRKSFVKQQRDQGREMSTALVGAREVAAKELDACRERTKDKCEGLDPCVIGKWRSEPVTNVGQKSTGGDGIALTIKSDGMTDIDYSNMKPIQGPSFAGRRASNLWRGKGTGRIETSEGNVTVATVEKEKSDVRAEITDERGKVTTNKFSGLGPVLPSGGKIEYSCEKDTFVTKVYGFDFTFKRAP